MMGLSLFHLEPPLPSEAILPLHGWWLHLHFLAPWFASKIKGKAQVKSSAVPEWSSSDPGCAPSRLQDVLPCLQIDTFDAPGWPHSSSNTHLQHNGSRMSVHGSRKIHYCLSVSFQRFRLTLHCFRLTLHCSRLTLHCSRLTLHCSRLTLHCSRLTLYCSRLTLHCSRLTRNGSRWLL